MRGRGGEGEGGDWVDGRGGRVEGRGGTREGKGRKGREDERGVKEWKGRIEKGKLKKGEERKGGRMKGG